MGLENYNKVVFKGELLRIEDGNNASGNNLRSFIPLPMGAGKSKVILGMGSILGSSGGMVGEEAAGLGFSVF